MIIHSNWSICFISELQGLIVQISRLFWSFVSNFKINPQQKINLTILFMWNLKIKEEEDINKKFYLSESIYYLFKVERCWKSHNICEAKDKIKFWQFNYGAFLLLLQVHLNIAQSKVFSRQKIPICIPIDPIERAFDSKCLIDFGHLCW